MQGSEGHYEIAETYTAGEPNRVQFQIRPVKHTALEIPLSHYYTHRPKLAGCIACEQGKCELTPIVRTEEDPGSLGIEGSRIRLDVDYVGRSFPLGSNGSKHMCVWQSSQGHFIMDDMKKIHMKVYGWHPPKLVGGVL